MPPGNGQFKYDPEEFGAAGTALMAATENIGDELTNLHLDVQTRLAEWNDGAADQYWIHKGEWDAAIAEMHSMLGSAAAPALGRISQSYGDAEDMVRRSFSG